MPKRFALNLLPCPRSLKMRAGKFILPKHKPLAAIKVVRTQAASARPEGYALTIDRSGVRIEFRETPGLRAATATLRQLLRQYGRHLPCLKFRDWPDFARRGVMLDISRGRVPKLETLLDLVGAVGSPPEVSAPGAGVGRRIHGLGRPLSDAGQRGVCVKSVVGQTSRSGCPLGRVLQDPLSSRYCAGRIRPGGLSVPPSPRRISGLAGS